jgi:hypothetical protein
VSAPRGDILQAVRQPIEFGHRVWPLGFLAIPACGRYGMDGASRSRDHDRLSGLHSTDELARRRPKEASFIASVVGVLGATLGWGADLHGVV